MMMNHQWFPCIGGRDVVPSRQLGAAMANSSTARDPKARVMLISPIGHADS